MQAELGIPYDKFLGQCPWIRENILSDDWLPRFSEHAN